MSRSYRPIANPSVVLREEFDDWAILFDPDTGAAFGLNPTGVFVWKRLDGNHSIPDLIQHLRTRAAKVSENAEAEVQAFLGELIRRGLAGCEVASPRSRS